MNTKNLFYPSTNIWSMNLNKKLTIISRKYWRWRQVENDSWILSLHGYCLTPSEYFSSLGWAKKEKLWFSDVSPNPIPIARSVYNDASCSPFQTQFLGGCTHLLISIQAYSKRWLEFFASFDLFICLSIYLFIYLDHFF